MTGRSLFRVLRWVGLAAVVPVPSGRASRAASRRRAEAGDDLQQDVPADDQPERRHAVPDRRLVVDAAVAGQPEPRTSRTFMTRAGEASRAVCPTSTSPSSRRTWARATARSPAATRRAARAASSSTRRAAPARRPAWRRARRTSRTSPASAELHRQPRGRVHLHRGARRERLRLRAPVRGHPARARRRRRAAARGEPGLPAPRRVPRDHHDHERGRLLRDADGVPLFDTGSNTNIVSQLGPPANFRCNEFGHLCDGGCTRTATRPTTTWPRRSPTRTARRTTGGLPLLERHRHRQPDQGAQGRSAARSSSRPSPARRRPTP